MRISINLSPRILVAHNLAPAVLHSFSPPRKLLAHQRAPLEHRASGGLIGPRAAHFLALTTASRPGILATAETRIGTGTCRRRAQSYCGNKKGGQHRSKNAQPQAHTRNNKLRNKSIVVFTYPHEVYLYSSQGNKRKLQGTPDAGHHRRRQADAAIALRAWQQLSGT